MSKGNPEILAPVDWLPAGLISWYAPGGLPVALVTSWVALIGGEQPRIRTSWHGKQDQMSRFWAGGDFIYNVPHKECLAKISRAMQHGRVCLGVNEDLDCVSMAGMAAVAPRLTECLVQIECINGQLVESGGETELCGDVVRLHRGQVVVDPNNVPDLCAIDPLSFY